MTSEKNLQILIAGSEDIPTPVVLSRKQRQEKEFQFLKDKIADRLHEITFQKIYESYFYSFLLVSLVFFCLGTIILCFGIFLQQMFHNDYYLILAVLALGSCFMCPFLIFLYNWFFPRAAEAETRKKIRHYVREREKVSDFNTMVEKSKETTKPKIKIRVILRFRKQVYPIRVETMGELCKKFEIEAGLPVAQQVFRIGEDFIKINLNSKLHQDCGFKNGLLIDVSNSGAYENSYGAGLYRDPIKNETILPKNSDIPLLEDPNNTSVLRVPVQEDFYSGLDALKREEEEKRRRRNNGRFFAEEGEEEEENQENKVEDFEASPSTSPLKHPYHQARVQSQLMSSQGPALAFPLSPSPIRQPSIMRSPPPSSLPSSSSSASFIEPFSPFASPVRTQPRHPPSSLPSPSSSTSTVLTSFSPSSSSSFSSPSRSMSVSTAGTGAGRRSVAWNV